MQAMQIHLNMQKKIDEIRKKYHHETVSHAFTSLFSWKEDMQLTALVEDHFFAVKCDLLSKNTWFFPCGDPAEIKKFIMQLNKENLCFTYMREADVDFLKQEFPDLFRIQPVLGDFEYLFDTKEQIELKGQKFKNLRKQVAHFSQTEGIRCEMLSTNNLKDAFAVCKNARESMMSPMGVCDHFANLVMLENFTKLKMEGMILYQNQTPLSVTGGFALTEDTFVISLAKESERISGLSAYSKWAFIKTLAGRYPFINGEEDLDIEGLRQLKNTMRPIHKIPIYRGEATYG